MIAIFNEIGYNISNMLNIVVTPYSYNPIGERITKRIVKFLKNEQVEYSVYFSQSFDDLKDNVKQLVSFGESSFVVVGDDATISMVIGCLKDLNKAKLGIVPTSKNDDFARYLKISSNPFQAMKDILQNNIENVDLLLVNDEPVFNNVIVGASVEAFDAYNQYKFKNIFLKKYAMAKYGKNYHGIDLIFDGKSKSKKETVFELVVANGGFSKGKLVSPLSNVQDGLFNVNYTTISSKPQKANYLKLFSKGDHIYNENTKQLWLKTLKINNPDKKIKAMIDGKIYNVEELNISIIENGLKIYKKK